MLYLYYDAGDDNCMNAYDDAMKVLRDLFGRDCLFALATSASDSVSVRFIDTCFDGDGFYVVTYRCSQKMVQIASNPNVALASLNMHRFDGTAVDLGHPLSPENSAIREKLIRVFEPWYFKHNDENDKNMAYMKIVPSNGFFHKDGTGYKVDFSNKTAEAFPFVSDISVSEE